MLDLKLTVNKLLIVLILAGLGCQELWRQMMETHFALWPLQSSPFGSEGVLFRPWQLLTHGFMHLGLWHMLFNVLAMLSIGDVLERRLGSRRYAVYYLGCMLGGAAAFLAVMALTEQTFAAAVGASGAVLGLLLAFALLYPKEEILPLFLPIPIPAWLFATLYAAALLYFGVTQTRQGMVHFAHLGGMAAGLLMMGYWWRAQPQPAA